MSSLTIIHVDEPSPARDAEAMTPQLQSMKGSVIVRLIVALFLVGAVMVGGVGCAGFKTENAQEFNLITTNRTPLFKTGPYQSTPPDAYLESGTRIRMIRAEGEYVQVETIHGMMGYVSSRDVGPAPM